MSTLLRLAPCFCLLISCVLYMPVKAQKTTILIGTTNGEVAESVIVCELDEQSESMKVVNKLKAGKRPGYLSLAGNNLYAVSTDAQGADQHTLRAFRLLNGGSGLEILSEVSSKGLNPCHIAVGRDGKSLYTANYSSGSIAQYAVLENGTLGDNLYFEQFVGKSVNQGRQEGPHAHYINTTIDNQFVLTADLGTDKVMIHRIDDNSKMIPYEYQPFLELPPGSGPRHLEFHPNNEWIYVLNELNSTITFVKYENETFKIIDTISTLPDDFNGISYAAAVRIHPNGKYIYSSNRGSDSISVFEIDDQGKVTMTQNFDPHLGWVRDFNITPSGNFIIAGNQKSNQVVLLKVSHNGKIEKYISSMEIPNPSCFVFYEGQK